MKKLVKLLTLALALLMILSSAAYASGTLEVPRNETLYINGLAWGAPENFNPVTGNPSFPNNGQRVVMFEFLYMYNHLTGEGEPLLADGPIEWVDQYNFTVKVKDAAKWNDGTALTNEDVAYTYNFAKKYTVNWSNNWTYLEKVEAIDGNKVQFTLKSAPYDRIQVPASLATVYILPKHIWEAREKESSDDISKLRAYTDLDTVVSSGPYKPFYHDNTNIIVVRDDSYWGQDASMFGKLPAPKYIAHQIFKDNAAGNLAMQEGMMDVSQQFIANVWEMWEKDPLISTYLPENPYYLAGSMPSLVFNVTKPGLDNAVVRRAIALATDFEAIAQDAMCGMSETLVPSIMLKKYHEKYLNPSEKIDTLRWDTTDLDENRETAKALLDEAGFKDADGDGKREMPDGSKIEWKVECPYGWSDWNASLEIVAQAGQAIGLNLITYFPESTVYDNDRFYGTFDMIMQSPHGDPNPGAPWTGIRNVLYSKDRPPIGEFAGWNQGRYSNPRIDELMDLIAGESDEVKIKAYYTEIEEIYLTDLPTVPLMYRPWLFHTVSEHVWTGFPKLNDGSNIPPQVCVAGAGIRALYNLKLVEAK
jgi:peptide/nickel transport system substrate-binding protein